MAPPQAANLVPGPAGNRRAAKHGGFVRKFTPAESREIAALKDEIRELVPLDSPSVEPAVSILAGLLWRRGRLYEFLVAKGLLRGRSDRTQIQPAVGALDDVEKMILTTMGKLGMLPKDAAALGLQLVRLERAREFDFQRLSKDERRTFDELLTKAEAVSDDPDLLDAA
jgi:hypothetical protein